MASDFEAAVKQGLMLTKRLFYGKEPAAIPPKLQTMLKSTVSLLPTAAMAYAVVPDPEAVDNPDVPSYQPYVHGTCDPPALMPLQMVGPVRTEVNCWSELATVSMSSSWRVHCIKAGRSCSCLFAVPLGTQGEILSVEVDSPTKQLESQIVLPEGDNAKQENGRFLKGNIYTFVILQIEAASIISAKFTWSQKIRYNEGEFCLKVPYNFPAFVNPTNDMGLKEETIIINVNSGTNRSVSFNGSSHDVQEISRDGGKVSFMYKSSVSLWSTCDFELTFSIPYDGVYVAALRQEESMNELDDGSMFCLYISPADSECRKPSKKDVVFVVDVSKSMEGAPLDAVKVAISSVFSKLDPQDSFNVVAFNDSVHCFSPTMQPATEVVLQKAIRWFAHKVPADGGTNIMLALQQALSLLAETGGSIPAVFLITDGSVDDERTICSFVEESLSNAKPFAPRISTFGIGTFYNQYFLQMIARLGRGHFGCSYDGGSVACELQRLFTVASSPVLLNVTVSPKNEADEFELLLPTIPDLSSQAPLILPGRYKGLFPDAVRVSAIFSDMSEYTVDVGLLASTDASLQQALARRYIAEATVDTWLMQSEDKQANIAQLSLRTKVPSEYCQVILTVSEKGAKQCESPMMRKQVNKIGSMMRKASLGDAKGIVLGSLGVGFGNQKLTEKNTPIGAVDAISADASQKLVRAASRLCDRTLGRCWCCVCFIGVCSRTTNQCAGLCSQICAALACFQIFAFCYEICNS